MKNRLLKTLILLTLIMSSCVSSDDPIQLNNLTFNFTHNWEGTSITNADFNDLKFLNENGETISIERLR